MRVKIIEKYKPEITIAVSLYFCLCFFPKPSYCNNDISRTKDSSQSYTSTSWKTAMNQPLSVKKNEYPDKKEITPKTIRLTLNEYYIPEVSELLNKGVDYFEWLNTIDDPYLNRYKLDIKVEPEDERLKLFWKGEF